MNKSHHVGMYASTHEKTNVDHEHGHDEEVEVTLLQEDGFGKVKEMAR